VDVDQASDQEKLHEAENPSGRSTRSASMKKALELVRGLRKDEEGAALIEYTVLLGIMLVAVIATIVLVGQWITGRWTALQAALP
jgi:pilus assembly protein Flp/PilA